MSTRGGDACRAPASSQTWCASRYGADCGFVAALGDTILGWLAPQPGERILDLGCGDGVFTAKVAASGAAVVGVDAAADMVEAARRRGFDARVADAHVLDLGETFDAVVSNAALHWMKEPDRVLAAVARLLRPGGRFVAEMGGFGNVAAIRVAIHAVLARRGLDGVALCPWYFPTREEYAERLERAGFRVERMELAPRPVSVASGMHAWCGNFTDSYQRALPRADRTAFVDEVVALLEPVMRRPDGAWFADYVRLRFHAVRASG